MLEIERAILRMSYLELTRYCEDIEASISDLVQHQGGMLTPTVLASILANTAEDSYNRETGEGSENE